MADFTLQSYSGEFMLLEDCVDQLTGVNVMEIHGTRKEGINCDVPVLVKPQNIDNEYFPILCIKLKLQDESTFVYIPHQTIILYPQKNKLFVHKIGKMGDSVYTDFLGRLLLPDWCLHWSCKKEIYDLHFNMLLEYRQEMASQGQFRNTKNMDTPCLHLIKEIKKIDQNQECKEYRLLLPPISVVLEGNPPEQL